MGEINTKVRKEQESEIDGKGGLGQCNEREEKSIDAQRRTK